MTGKVWRITSKDTYSCGLHKVGHLLHTLPTTCLMRDSNLSTRGHIRREYYHPNLWQRLAFFSRYIYIIVQNNRFFSLFLQLTVLSKRHFHSHQTLCHYRQFGQRNMLSLWHRASELGSRWQCFCRTRKMVTLLRLRHIRKGQNFHRWMSANSLPKRHCGHFHSSIKRVIKFEIHTEQFLLH